MAGVKKRSKKTENRSTRAIPPVFSPEAAENLGISLAYDLVFERLRDGTATSQETTYFLKLGSSKTQLEKEKLKSENEVLRGKVEMYRAEQKEKLDYEKVLTSLKRYQGNFGDEEDYSDYVEFEGI